MYSVYEGLPFVLVGLLLVAIGIGIGGTVEALIGVAVLRRFAPFAALCGRAREAIKFSAICGVFCCAVGTAVSVTDSLIQIISSSISATVVAEAIVMICTHESELPHSSVAVQVRVTIVKSP